jgi:RNA polymerase sigma-70 factor (ECF subfamily)
MGAEARSRAESPAPADADVIERARAGDHAAFRVLVERYQGRAYGLALRVLRDEEQARDAVQDVFLKVYGSLDRFEGRSSFYTWLYRLVMNRCLDLKRRDRSERHVEWDEEQATQTEELPSAHHFAGPGEQLERAELRALVARAIDALPEDARRTIQLREIDGLSYAEIAASLGVPKGTVMSRLHYARRRLRAALAEAVQPAPAGSGVEGGA